MNQDVRINVDFFSHHKTLRLKRKLGHEGIVSLLSLFCYTGKTRADGTLQGMDAEDIAAASGWAGEPQEYVSTLCEIGFLERCEEGVYSVHDWQDHNQWASNANDRSDSARLSKLAQVNPEKAKEYREAGRVGITAKEYSLSAKQRNASERSANAVRTAGETLAPSPSPAPLPSPAQNASEDNTEGGGPAVPIDPKAFSGFAIYHQDGEMRINNRDLESWKSAYSHLDIPAQLQALSDWTRETREWTKKDAFHRTSATLKLRDERARILAEEKRRDEARQDKKPMTLEERKRAEWLASGQAVN